MAALGYILLAVLACKTQAQFLPQAAPLTAPLLPQPQVISTCDGIPTTTSQVVTTVIDNSVANALANAIQLLIVSNLIENTMGSPVANALTSNLPAVVEPITVQASLYSPPIEYIAPTVDYVSPYPGYNPVVSPYDVIAPCEPVVEILPAVYPEVVGGCGCDIATNIGYSNLPINGVPGIGLPNMGFPCGPNVGVEVLANPYNPIAPGYAFEGPIVAPVAEVIYPSPPPQYGCNCGMPNYGAPNINGLFGPMGPNINPMSLLASQLLGNGLFM